MKITWNFPTWQEIRTTAVGLVFFGYLLALVLVLARLAA